MIDGFTSVRLWLAGVAFLLLPASAWADHFEEVVGLRCDTAGGQLTVVHQGAYNDAGSTLTTHLSHINGMFDRSLTLQVFRGPLAEAARFTA